MPRYVIASMARSHCRAASKICSTRTTYSPRVIAPRAARTPLEYATASTEQSRTGMGNRLSRIYTRTGDDGSTGLGDGNRVRKDDARVEAYGTVDEANSAIGVILSVPGLPGEVARCLTEIQHDLFDLGGELCIPGTKVIK